MDWSLYSTFSGFYQHSRDFYCIQYIYIHTVQPSTDCRGHHARSPCSSRDSNTRILLVAEAGDGATDAPPVDMIESLWGCYRGSCSVWEMVMAVTRLDFIPLPGTSGCLLSGSARLSVLVAKHGSICCLHNWCFLIFCFKLRSNVVTRKTCIDDQSLSMFLWMTEYQALHNSAHSV